MGYFEEIKTDLPEFPDDLIMQWLVPFAEAEGWPPAVDHMSNITGRWRYIFRLRNMNHWRSLRWSKRSLVLEPTQMTPKDCGLVFELASGHVKDEVNIYSMADASSKPRFERIRRHLREAGVYPRTPAIEQVNGKYRLVDGSHRLAAYFYLYGYFNIEGKDAPCLNVLEEQEYWVGLRVTDKCDGAE